MNILIVKTGALGDVVRTSFIAQALKERYKQAKIFWLTDKKAIPLFINNPYIHRVIKEENKENLRKINFDIVINLEEYEEICKFASSLKYKEIIGFICKNGKISPTPTAKEWFDMSALGKKPESDILKKKNKKTHRQIMAEIVGIKNYEKYEPFLRLTPKQRQIADNFLRRHNLSRKELIIGINSGGGERWPKNLPIKKVAWLIDKLYKQFNAKILLFGGPEEIERNREILKLAKSPVITTGCGNDLFEFPALISVCSLFITTNTLGLHVSLALKRKTICLIGPTSPTEIDTYGLGEKIISKSKSVCTYAKAPKNIMEKISLDETLFVVKKLLSQKMTLLITAFDEPNIAKAVESALNQKTKYNYEVILSAPDESTLKIAKNYLKNKNFKIIKDPGKGKSFALNYCFDKIKTDILILTDGDIYLNENVVEEISNLFLDPEIGCVSGRPAPQESRNTKYGYWAHFLFDSAHRIRKKAFLSNSFIECTGYLFAFRKNKIKKIPVDVAEDTVIPYLLWQKGYKIGYAEKAEVYVKNADNWLDWLKQKTRTHKAHEKLHLYVDTKITPKVKTFKTEFKGIFWLLRYPKNFQEFIWADQLAFSRLMTWVKYYLDTKLLGRKYQDAWKRIESTK